jgi:hypothetical protein
MSADGINTIFNYLFGKKTKNLGKSENPFSDPLKEDCSGLR